VAHSDPSDKKNPQKPLSLPVYGNYCGVGHGDPTFQTPPVDAVDLVCREHDRCYGLLGDFDERCDRNLIEMMPNAIALTPTPLGKQVGAPDDAVLLVSRTEPRARRDPLQGRLTRTIEKANLLAEPEARVAKAGTTAKGSRVALVEWVAFMRPSAGSRILRTSS